MAAARPLQRWPWYASACLALWLGASGVRPLFNPDEGRYAEIPRAMLESGDWTVPRLNGLVYLEKPPLQYWATALAYAAFGTSEWTARLFCALAAVLTVIATWRLAALWRSRAEAVGAAAMLSSMLLFVFMGQLVTLDMALGAFLTVAVTALCTAQRLRSTDGDASRRAMLVCWAAMAAATLTKGLVGIVLPGIVLVAYTALQRDVEVWRHLQVARGGSLYALVAAPWFGLVERAHPGALQFLIVREHFQRYLTTVHDRYEPWWYFLAIVAAGSLPWLAQTVRAFATGWRREAPVGEFDTGRLLWTTATVVLFFFSLSGSKLAPYVVPLLPPLAVLGARDGAHAARDMRFTAALQLGLGAVLVTGSLLTAFLPLATSAAALAVALRPWLVLAGTAMVVGGVLGWRSAPGNRHRAVLHVATAGFLASWLLVVPGANAIASRYSGQPLLAAAGHLDRSVPVYTVATFDWTLPFYLGHPIIPVAWRGELDYGLGLEPTKGLPSLDAWRAEWMNASDAYALVPIPLANRVAAAGLPMRELARDSRRVLLSRR